MQAPVAISQILMVPVDETPTFRLLLAIGREYDRKLIEPLPAGLEHVFV